MRAMTVSHVVCNAQSRLAQEICQYQSPRRLDQGLLATQDATCLPTLFYHASCAVNNRLAAWYQAKTVGKLARAKSFSKRATSSKERSPNCSDNTAAIIVPAATASPCNQFP